MQINKFFPVSELVTELDSLVKETDTFKKNMLKVGMFLCRNSPPQTSIVIDDLLSANYRKKSLL